MVWRFDSPLIYCEQYTVSLCSVPPAHPSLNIEAASRRAILGVPTNATLPPPHIRRGNPRKDSPPSAILKTDWSKQLSTSFERALKVDDGTPESELFSC
ncbi:hypothetical protein GPALN_011961 [Globodera pallida]|nr:hypothetical protein GPALN_011961 [Globodera pallida]